MTGSASYYKFLVFYFTIMVMFAILQHIWKWANENPAIALLPFLGAPLFYSAKWLYKKRLLEHPFIVREYREENILSKDIIRIMCLNGVWHRDKLGINLYYKARRKINLKLVNLRFIEKPFLGQAKNAPKDIISIKDIDFPKEQYFSKVTWRDDGVGGKDGIFNPPLELSRGNVIFIKVYPAINVPWEWRGYISLDNKTSGDEKRPKPTRKHVIITNELMQ